MGPSIIYSLYGRCPHQLRGCSSHLLKYRFYEAYSCSAHKYIMSQKKNVLGYRVGQKLNSKSIHFHQVALRSVQAFYDKGSFLCSQNQFLFMVKQRKKNILLVARVTENEMPLSTKLFVAASETYAGVLFLFSLLVFQMFAKA